jgi:DNA-binding MarR family transcriptional regulator
MTNRIDRLEERGFVERRPDQYDRRSVIVHLTRAGKQAIDEAIRVRLDAADTGLAHLGKTQRRQLAELLREAVTGDSDAD